MQGTLHRTGEGIANIPFISGEYRRQTDGVNADRVIREEANDSKRSLWMTCIAHALHDGYTDLIYVMLPVWQADFGLSYVTLAVLRCLYVGAMAGPDYFLRNLDLARWMHVI
jgi:hypothetical protein